MQELIEQILGSKANEKIQTQFQRRRVTILTLLLEVMRRTTNDVVT